MKKADTRGSAPTGKEPVRLALTVDQAASALACSRITVWRLMNSGALRFFHVSQRLRRVSIAEIERFIAERQEQESA